VGFAGRSLLFRFVSPARASVSPGRLRALREQAGLTQHELAGRVGVIGGARVSAWEQGRSIPRPETLHKLAAALGVDVAALFDVGPGGVGVRELRLEAGLTMDQLARRVSVSVPTVQRWEYGDFKRLPPVATIDLAAQALGVTRDRVTQAFQSSRDARS